MQTRLGSFVEAWANIVVGFGIQFTAVAIFLPLLGIGTISVQQNLKLGVIMTVISIARSYLLRRFFNKLRLFTYATREVREEEKAGIEAVRQPKAQER